MPSRPGRVVGEPLDRPRLSLLGAVELTTPDGSVALGGPVQRAILARLALDRGRSVAAEVLVDGIWGSAAGDRTRRSLATLTSRLRRAIEPIGWTVASGSGAYRLDAPSGATDLEVFEEAMAAARRAGAQPARAAGLAEDALGLWGEMPLAGLDAPFAVGARERMVEMRVRAEDELVDWLLAAGRTDRAIELLRSMVEATPYQEARWIRLVEALDRTGRAHEALTVHRRAVTLLRDELGLEPSAALTRAEYRVLDGIDAGPPDAPERAAPIPFVGRAEEFTAFVDAVFKNRRSGGTLVLLVRGESGIGKTRFIDEAARSVAGVATVISGSCAPGSAAPIGAIVEPLLARLSTEDRVALGPSAIELERLVLPGEALGDAAMLEVRVGRAALDALALLSTRTHVVLTVDDMQWSDAVTRRIIGDIARAEFELGVTIALVERTDVERSEFAHWLDALGRDLTVRSIGLGPIERSAAGEVVAAVLPDPEAWSDEIFRASGGNPLLTIELATLLAADGTEWTGPLPDRTQRLLAARAARLGATTCSLLEVAALLGDAACEADAAAVLGLTAREVRSGTMAAEAAGILTTDPSGDWAFTHAAWREHFDARLAGEARARLHARAARLATDRGDDPIAAALHAEAAGTTLDAGARADALLAGGRSAIAEGRTEVALRLLEAARATGALGAPDSIVATIGLGEVHLALGDVARGSALLERAWDEAGAIDAWDLAAEVALAFSRIGLLPTPDSGAARADQAEVAFARLGDSDPFRRGLLATYLYNILAFVDEPRASSYLDEAVRMAERDPALAPYVDVCVLRRDVETGREPTVAVHTAAALARRDRRTNPLAAAMAEVLGAAAAVAAGEALDGAVLDRLVVEGRELGRADVTHYAMSVTSLVDSVGRDARRAERSVGAAQEFGAAAGLPVAGTVGLLQGAAIRRETQRTREIRPMLEFATSAGYPPFPLLLAEARLADGDAAGATELVAGVLLGLADLPSWARASSAALAVEVIDLLGLDPERRDVADLTSILAPQSGQMVVLALVAMHLGPADRYLARLALRSGDLDRALDRILAARELASAAETVLWSGWCAVDEAVIRARRGESAAGLLDEAAGVARALGSLRLAAAVDAAR